MKVIPNARNIANANKITPSDAVFCFGAENALAIAKNAITAVVKIFKIINPIMSVLPPTQNNLLSAISVRMQCTELLKLYLCRNPVQSGNYFRKE